MTKKPRATGGVFEYLKVADEENRMTGGVCMPCLAISHEDRK